MSTVSVADMAPIPGNPDGIRRHAGRYTRTAAAIGEAIDMLRAVQNASEEERSDAVEALGGAIGDTQSHLSQIRNRYEVAGSALTMFADVLESAQAEAGRAMVAHDEALRRRAYLQGRADEARDATRSTVDPAELSDATDTVRRYASLAEAASGDVNSALAAHRAAVHRVEVAGNDAAELIAHAVDQDGANDSRWDNFLDWVNDNAGWLSVVKDVLSVVTMIVGALSIFFPVLAPIALGLAALTAGLSFILAAAGSGSWLDFGLDMIGVLTFGIGTAAIGVIKLGGVALRGTRAVRLAVTSPRTVYGNTLREAGSNLIERGLVGTARRPLDMVRGEVASVVPARPGLTDVLRRTDTPWMTQIRDSHVVIAEFNRMAQQARLGAGGLVDRLLIGGAESMARTYTVASGVGTALDVYNGAGMVMNRGVDWAADAVGDSSPLGGVLSGAVDAWNAPGDALTHDIGDWKAGPFQ